MRRITLFLSLAAITGTTALAEDSGFRPSEAQGNRLRQGAENCRHDGRPDRGELGWREPEWRSQQDLEWATWTPDMTAVAADLGVTTTGVPVVFATVERPLWSSGPQSCKPVYHLTNYAGIGVNVEGTKSSANGQVTAGRKEIPLSISLAKGDAGQQGIETEEQVGGNAKASLYMIAPGSGLWEHPCSAGNGVDCMTLWGKFHFDHCECTGCPCSMHLVTVRYDGGIVGNLKYRSPGGGSVGYRLDGLWMDADPSATGFLNARPGYCSYPVEREISFLIGPGGTKSIYHLWVDYKLANGTTGSADLTLSVAVNMYVVSVECVP